MEKTDILIIGSGIAAVAAAEAARKENASVGIMICSAEEALPYYRLRLCEKLNEPEKSLALHPQSWYDERRLMLRAGARAVGLDPAGRLVRFADGRAVSYGRLIIATGSHSFIPPIKGADGADVYSLWTLEDSLRLSRAAEKGRTAAVLGGGLLGLETAHKLMQAGVKVTVLESSPSLLGRQTDQTASGLFLKKVRALGIDVKLNALTTEIADVPGGKCLNFQDGSSLLCDFAVISTGVRPNIDWLADSGLTVERQVVVNDRMETSLPDVYAAGDVAVQDGLWFGLWSIALAQGKTAGCNAASGDASYKIEVPPYVLNTMGTTLASAGVYPDEPQPYEEREIDEEHFTYRRVIYATEDKEGPVKGYITLGGNREYVSLQKRLQS